MVLVHVLQVIDCLKVSNYSSWSVRHGEHIQFNICERIVNNIKWWLFILSIHIYVGLSLVHAMCIQLDATVIPQQQQQSRKNNKSHKDAQ